MNALVTKALHSFGFGWSASAAIKATKEDIFPHLDALTALSQLQLQNNTLFLHRFTAEFCLGPGGIHPVIAFLLRFEELLAITSEVESDEVIILDGTVQMHSSALLSLVLHFRTTVNRALYDPVGFRDLRDVLCQDLSRFAVSL